MSSVSGVIMRSGAAVQELEEAWEKLHLEKEDEGGMELEPEELQRIAGKRTDICFYLVGRFLIEKSVNFMAMKNTLGSLWELGKGITITELGARRYLFQFFHEVDVNAVINSGPWTFNQHMLVLRRLALGRHRIGR